MTESSPPSTGGRRRTLIGLAAAALVLLALVGVDRAVARALPTRGQLTERVEALDLAADQRHLLILGTCLSEQHILLPELNAAMPAGWQVTNLGAPATTPVEWYLAWKNYLPHDRVGALAIAYGRFDLTEPMTPWESETLDLARGDDMDEVIARSCDTAECRLDLSLQRYSALWRYRPVLAALVWHRLGMAPPTDLKDARLRVVEGLRSTTAEVWDPESPSVHYLARLISEAQASGTTVVLMPLPLRPDPLDAHQQSTYARLDQGLATLRADTGVQALPTPELDRALFTDEVHLGPDGAHAYTAWLSERLPPLLAGR